MSVSGLLSVSRAVLYWATFLISSFRWASSASACSSCLRRAGRSSRMSRAEARAGLGLSQAFDGRLQVGFQLLRAAPRLGLSYQFAQPLQRWGH
ncbi:MAG: hypothetical protein U0835_16310 [Isosphaeraceae bacterium]